MSALRRRLCLVAASLLVGACAAPAPPMSPQLVSHLGYQALGPEMQMGEQLVTVWVPAAPPPAAGAPVLSPEATVALAAASSPMISDLAQVMARGAREPVNLAVGGPDSALTVQVLIRALRAVPAAVPNLRIAFVGQPVDVNELLAVAGQRRASLQFELAPK
ncbi:MAG: hypothetical protein EOO24_35740 [Comamonadaceae bacterium]|nr:MAG: hypothetical protein EOO24_35740 [Comamonadaceae bacterium]